MPQSTRLTVAQKRWCELVNNGMNRTKAAALLWPHLTAPNQKAYLLGQLPHLQAYLEKLDAKCQEHAGLTRTFVLRQLKAVAGFDPRNLYNQDGTLKDVNQLDEETALALASIEIDEITEGSADAPVRRRTKRVKHWSKTEALRLCAQIMGMLAKEQIELSGPGGGPVRYERIEIVGVEPAKKDEPQKP